MRRATAALRLRRPGAGTAAGARMIRGSRRRDSPGWCASCDPLSPSCPFHRGHEPLGRTRGRSRIEHERQLRFLVARGRPTAPAHPPLPRAHRRDRLRLRRRRAEVRPDLRRRLREDGQRRLDGGDHPRRDPAAAARRPRAPAAIRIRIGAAPVTNWGDETNLVVAFNEQVLLARHRLGALADDAIVLVENKWATHDDADDPRGVGRGDDGALQRAATGSSTVPDGGAVPHRSWTTRARARTCSRSACSPGSTAATWSASRSRSRTRSARRPRRSTSANVALMELGYALGGGAPRLPDRGPADASRPAAWS